VRFDVGLRDRLSPSALAPWARRRHIEIPKRTPAIAQGCIISIQEAAGFDEKVLISTEYIDDSGW